MVLTNYVAQTVLGAHCGLSIEDFRCGMSG